MGLRKPHPAALEDGGKWLEVPQHLGTMFTSINSLDLGKIVTTNADFMSWTARKVRKSYENCSAVMEIRALTAR